MKKFIPHIIFSILMIGLSFPAEATKCETTQSGFFGDNIWSCSGGETFETADTLVINHDVEMKNHTTYSIQADVVIIKVGYEMEFLSNAKLIMTSAGAEIVLENNAEIFTNNNASGTLIEINHTAVWGGSNCSSCNNEPMSGAEVINEFSSPGNGDLLPIELISFSAEKKGSGVNISWTTAEEVNNDFFTIYRSADAENWESIATINGAGTIYETQHYQIEDSEVSAGTYYYRLKQTDFNGKFKYFEIRSVTLDEMAVSFYPNPAMDFVQVSASVGNYQVEVSDLSGRKVLSANLSGNKQLDVSSLPSGVYHLSLIGNNGTISKKLVIQ